MKYLILTFTIGLSFFTVATASATVKNDEALKKELLIKSLADKIIWLAKTNKEAAYFLGVNFKNTGEILEKSNLMFDNGNNNDKQGLIIKQGEGSKTLVLNDSAFDQKDLKKSVMNAGELLCELGKNPSCAIEKVRYELFWNRFHESLLSRSDCKLSLLPIKSNNYDKEFQTSLSKTATLALLNAGLGYSSRNGRIYLQLDLNESATLDKSGQHLNVLKGRILALDSTTGEIIFQKELISHSELYSLAHKEKMFSLVEKVFKGEMANTVKQYCENNTHE